VLERFGGTRAALVEPESALRKLLFDHRPLLFVALVSALFLNALVFAEYAALFAAFGARPSLPELAGSLLGVGLAHALPVPGSIGALEVAQAALVGAAGGDASLAITAATAARLRDLAWTLPGLAWLVAGTRRREHRI